MKGERRQLKAATSLSLIYVSVFGLHLVSWGHQVVMALLGVMTIHALRLLVTPATVQVLTSTDQEVPFISLLVAAKNEEAVIGNLVQTLCQIEYARDRLELWVIDDNSNDHTPIILEQLQQKYTQLKVLRRGEEAKGGKSGALNQVLPLTHGEIIGVFDADAQVPDNVLAALLPLFQSPRTGAVQLRKSINNVSTNFWTKGQAAEMALDIFFQNRRHRVGGIGELRGNGQFVRRSALDSCGGWNEETITDDLDLTIRLHLDKWDISCLIHPAVQEEGVVTGKQLWHQRNRWAEGGYQRYLDYWSLIAKNKMGTTKTFDLVVFLLIQYILPTATIPDLVGAIALNQRPLLAPIFTLTTILAAIGMTSGIRQSCQRQSLFLSLWQTLRGSLYMLHWIPVLTSVTLRMSVRPKRLRWVKTIHKGLGDRLLLDELDSEFKAEH